jgi:GNAT superfamily N-acetyltransferase
VNNKWSEPVSDTPIIRAAEPEDCPRIAALANQLNVLLGKPDGVFKPEALRRDLFGQPPAVKSLVATTGGEVIAYTLHALGYNSDIAARELWLIDILVDEPWRGRGVGRRMMAALAGEALRLGARSLGWGVLPHNRPALGFYAKLEAENEAVRFFALQDEALRRLAGEAE